MLILIIQKVRKSFRTLLTQPWNVHARWNKPLLSVKFS